MKKLILLLLSVFMFSFYIQAQPWLSQVSGTSQHFYSIDFPNDFVGFAVGVSGTIVKTINGGSTWMVLNSGTTQVLSDVKFIDADTGFVAGQNGTLLKTTDGGSTWINMPTGFSGHFSHIIKTNSAIIANTYTGLVYKSTDNGATWNSYPTGISTNLYALYFLNDSVGYVGGLTGQLAKTTDAGVTWSLLNSSTNIQLSSIWFTDANTGYYVSFHYSSDTCVIAKTLDGGITWTQQSFTTFALGRIQFLDSNVGYATGGSIAANTSMLLKTSDAGVTWIPQYTNNFRLMCSSFPSNHIGYTCGLNGLIMKTTNIYLGTDGVSGFVYHDTNTNCGRDTTDTPLVNIPVKLLNGSMSMVGLTYTASNGSYKIEDTTGTYTTKISTSSLPYMAQCPFPGNDSIVTMTAASPSVTNVNFALKCKPGFDIGVQSIVNNGIIFPGWQWGFRVVAGDMCQWYGMHCASGISGQVQITISGPQVYDGIMSGSLTPVVAGNVYTYSISDFDSIDINTAFGLLFHTDTTAQIGDTICVYINVSSPSCPDNVPSNNCYHRCYNVTNSYDPNYKDTYPQTVSPGYADNFTYTIHFQNTGTAAAANIVLKDTLDANLDLSTFEVINYSHPNTVSLNANRLSFNFNNINLPDSSSNFDGSQGFVQYHIMPLSGLPPGTQIHNRASIYFDYNPAVLTNATINEYNLPIGISSISTSNSFQIFPNPSSGMYSIKLADNVNLNNATITIKNLLGEIILKTNPKNSVSLFDFSSYPNGIYFINVKTEKGICTQKLALVK